MNILLFLQTNEITIMFGKFITKEKIINLSNVNSTNEFASDLLKNNEMNEGTVIWAISQSKGKGQKGNVWESEFAKNLTFSLIIHPTMIAPSHQFLLNKAVSLGMIDFLKTKLDDNLIKIKWPNDIYIGNFKIAGILIENEILGSVFQSSIIGIGLNVNQINFSSNIPNPTSLKIISGNDWNIEEVLIELLIKVEARIINLYNNDIELINNDYLNNLLNFNIIKKYYWNNIEILAMITDINEYGQLILETIEKDIIKCNFKEILLIHD